MLEFIRGPVPVLGDSQNGGAIVHGFRDVWRRLFFFLFFFGGDKGFESLKELSCIIQELYEIFKTVQV